MYPKVGRVLRFILSFEPTESTLLSWIPGVAILSCRPSSLVVDGTVGPPVQSYLRSRLIHGECYVGRELIIVHASFPLWKIHVNNYCAWGQDYIYTNKLNKSTVARLKNELFQTSSTEEVKLTININDRLKNELF